jgi:hypothetical protein
VINETRRLEPYRLGGTELATAIVYGTDPTLAPLRVDDGPSAPPRVVLEAILRRALEHPPCVIGFSGGRDSSALLALAAYVAVREGLAAPVAATNVFPGDARAAESDWQETLIRHVGIKHWERLGFTSEMDVIGPVAAPMLRRFGPTFPFNGHFGLPSSALAAEGTYITGIGGDELFEPNDLTRLALVLTGRLRPRRNDLLTAFRTFGPARLRIRHYRRLVPEEPWLRPGVNRAFVEDLARVLAHQRLWYSEQLCAEVWRDRSRSALQATLGAFAGTLATVMVHPFQDPDLIRSIAVHTGRAPWPGRAAAMRELFGDVLPDALVRRPTKASFDSIFFNEHSRAFVEGWDGTGVDVGLVDPDQLRKSWQRPSVDARSLSLLQGAWCHQADISTD